MSGSVQTSIQLLDSEFPQPNKNIQFTIQYPITVKEIYSKKVVRSGNFFYNDLVFLIFIFFLKGSNFLIGVSILNKLSTPFTNKVKICLEHGNLMHCIGETEITLDFIESNGVIKKVFECGIDSKAEEAEEVEWKIHLYYLNNRGETRYVEYYSSTTSVAVTYNRHLLPGNVLVVSDFILSKKLHDSWKIFFRTLGMPLDFWNIEVNDNCIPDWLLERYFGKMIILLFNSSSSFGYLNFQILLKHLSDPDRESSLLIFSNIASKTFLSSLNIACDNNGFYTTETKKSEWAEVYKWTKPHPDAANKAARALLEKYQNMDPSFPYHISFLDFDFQQCNTNPNLWYYGTLKISHLPIHKLSYLAICDSLNPTSLEFPMLDGKPCSIDTPAFKNMQTVISLIPLTEKFRMLLDRSITIWFTKPPSRNTFKFEDVIAEAIFRDLQEELNFLKKYPQLSKFRIQRFKNFLESSKDYLPAAFNEVQYIINRLHQTFGNIEYTNNLGEFFSNIVQRANKNAKEIESEGNLKQEVPFQVSLIKPLQE